MTSIRTILFAGTLLTGAALAQESPGADAPYHYTGQVRIDPQSGHIAAEWVIEVNEPEPRERTFLLRDTLPEVAVVGDVAGFTTGRREGLDGFLAVTVQLPVDVASPVVRLSYEGVPIPVPMDNDINGIEPDRVELNVDSFWFPIDARFSKELIAEVLVLIPGDGWQAVTTGEAVPVEGGFRLVNADPRLDIAFTLSRHFRITQAEGFTLYDQRESAAGTDALVETAAFCRAFLDQRWGQAAPLPASRLLIARRSESGYARENYIVFTDIANTRPPELTRFVCHEFAHHWASGGKFDTVDNWINEGFAETLGMMAVRERLGQAAYDALQDTMKDQVAGQSLPPIWTPGATERGPYLVNYRKAPLALARLESTIGRERFLAFTQSLLVQPVKTTPGLLDTLESVAGTEARAGFEAILAE